MKNKTGRLPAYKSVACTDAVHWKLEQVRRILCDKWNRRVTMSEAIDWMIDYAALESELEDPRD
jgi:hypothetical protein